MKILSLTEVYNFFTQRKKPTRQLAFLSSMQYFINYASNINYCLHLHRFDRPTLITSYLKKSLKWLNEFNTNNTTITPKSILENTTLNRYICTEYK